MEKIAILIPCFNEEKSISKVVKDFKNCLPQAEIYVFDNNSSDNSVEEARKAGANIIPVPYKGKGNVVKIMFRKIDADVYVIVDGDDTYPANYIYKLIDPIVKEEADMVVGDRLSSSYFIENKRRFHNSGNKLMCRLINLMFNSDLKDVLSGYRAFSRDFVKSINIISHGFEIETELTAFALQNQFLIKQVVIPYKDRNKDNPSKLNTMKDGVSILKMLAILIKNYKPFSFFSIIALAIFVVALILIIPVFNEYFETGLVARFPTLIFSCFLLMASLLLFCCGLILQVTIKSNYR